jgi:hypothetical protein
MACRCLVRCRKAILLGIYRLTLQSRGDTLGCFYIPARANKQSALGVVRTFTFIVWTVHPHSQGGVFVSIENAFIVQMSKYSATLLETPLMHYEGPTTLLCEAKGQNQ